MKAVSLISSSFILFILCCKEFYFLFKQVHWACQKNISCDWVQLKMFDVKGNKKLFYILVNTSPTKAQLNTAA